MATVAVDRSDVIAFRFHRHQLDRPPGSADATAVHILDIGVQDTGTEGSAWALAVRGARSSAGGDLFLAWTLRGAPHAYRRSDAAAVMVATAPLSEADAASRIFDGAKPLRDNGIKVLDALRTIASIMRDVARRPITKGDLSSELTGRVDKPFLRFCRPCNTTHIYEQVFRLPAFQAGLELEPGTSPPVLRRIKAIRPKPYERHGTEAGPQHEVIRGYLRFFGPAPVKAIATYLDAPVAEISANLPSDAVELTVHGADPKPKRYGLASDIDTLMGAASRAEKGVVRLVGSHDPYLQLRDRDVLVPESSRHKDLWRTLGRPGAVLVDGEVAATWRPKASAKALAIHIEPWVSLTRATRRLLPDEAERLAAHRGLALGSLDGI